MADRDEYIAEKRFIRRNEYEANVHRLDERVYGLDTPVLSFITENGKYSDKAIERFIDCVLDDHKNNEYLRSSLYLRLRTAVTEFRPFYLSDEGEPRGLTIRSLTVCERGRAAEQTLSNLFCRWRPAAGFLYRDLFDDYDQEIVDFIAGEYDDPYDTSDIDQDELDDDFRWMVADMEEHPEKTEREQRELDEAMEEQIRYLASLSDEEREEMEKEQEYQQTPEYWDNYMKQVAEDDRKHYNAQKKHLLLAFPDKEGFRKNIETYYRIGKSLEQDASLTTDTWEGLLIEDCLKKYLSTTTYSIFADRSNVVKVDAQLIHARAIAGKAHRDEE